MTRNFIIYICLLMGFTIIHYFGIYDLKMFSIIITVIIAIMLMGGNHSAMRTYSSMDVKNAEYDASHINDEPSLEIILKVGIPLVIYLLIIFNI